MSGPTTCEQIRLQIGRQTDNSAHLFRGRSKKPINANRISRAVSASLSQIVAYKAPAANEISPPRVSRLSRPFSIASREDNGGGGFNERRRRRCRRLPLAASHKGATKEAALPRRRSARADKLASGPALADCRYDNSSGCLAVGNKCCLVAHSLVGARKRAGRIAGWACAGFPADRRREHNAGRLGRARSILSTPSDVSAAPVAALIIGGRPLGAPN